jgi:hypothetical protein
LEFNILRLPLAAAADGRLARATQAQQARRIAITLEAILVAQLISERGYNSGGFVMGFRFDTVVYRERKSCRRSAHARGLYTVTCERRRDYSIRKPPMTPYLTNATCRLRRSGDARNANVSGFRQQIAASVP